MSFTNIIFLFVFLPATLLLHCAGRKEHRNLILLVMSLVFYACGEPRFVLVMLLSIICNYYLALAIERLSWKKSFLILSILYNFGVLFFFKYLGFSISAFNFLFHKNVPVLEIALPIGISFYTFQIMSYVIDVYWNKVKAEHNMLNLGLYILLFPQLVVGPIVRYQSIEKQIRDRTLTAELFGAGAKRFMCGFCKKVILANNLANAADFFFENHTTENSVIGAWVGAISFSLQIYYDFSGYTDMAIGLGKMLGFEFEENFNYPYFSKSVSEFWRKWHISLSRWFRDYVYIPLGGSRVSTPRHILNLAVVWVLTGLWHGADYTFLMWGGLYFAALVAEKYIIRPERRKSRLFTVLYRILTLGYVNFGWVLFRSDNVRTGIRYCLSMIGVPFGNAVIDLPAIRILREYGVFLAMGMLFAIPIAPWLSGKLKGKLSFVGRYILPVLHAAGFLWAVSYLILGAHNPFVYFNF